MLQIKQRSIFLRLLVEIGKEMLRCEVSPYVLYRDRMRPEHRGHHLRAAQSVRKYEPSPIYCASDRW